MKTISKFKWEGYKHVNKETEKPDFYKFMSTKSSKTKRQTFIKKKKKGHLDCEK